MLLVSMPSAAQEVGGNNSGGNNQTTKQPNNPATKKKAPNGISDFVFENYTPITFSYQSIDGKKNPIMLSAMAYLPRKYSTVSIEHILLACHPTVTSNSEAPTGSNPLDGEIKRMCGEDGNWMVICPDYCGYKHSSYRQHPYLIHDVTARNCIDAVMEAIKNVNEKKWVTSVMQSDGSGGSYFVDYDFEFTRNYSTDIVGYSQGGATALACTKYLGSNGCPDDVKNTIRLRHTCCGDGPYSISATLNKYMEWGDPKREDEGLDLEYPCVLPLIMAAAKDAYNDGCMRTVEVEDYFNRDFLEKTDVLNLLRSKATATEDINAKIKESWKGRLRPVDIFSREIIDENGNFITESNLYKCLMKVCRLADLTQGWEPTTPISFAHLHADHVVPYANWEEVRKGIGKEGKNELIRFVDIEQPHNPEGSPVIEWMGYWMQDLDGTPDYSTMSHTTGGVVFYINYLFGKYMRPEARM